MCDENGPFKNVLHSGSCSNRFNNDWRSTCSTAQALLVKCFNRKATAAGRSPSPPMPSPSCAPSTATSSLVTTRDGAPLAYGKHIDGLRPFENPAFIAWGDRSKAGMTAQEN